MVSFSDSMPALLTTAICILFLPFDKGIFSVCRQFNFSFESIGNPFLPKIGTSLTKTLILLSGIC